jgi:hypothetical protein
MNVPSEVLAFLFGDHGLRADRLLTLPADQAASLQAFVGRGAAMPAPQPASAAPQPDAALQPNAERQARHSTPAVPPALAAQLIQAQALLASGRSARDAAAQLGVTDRRLFRTFDAQGHLLIGRSIAPLLRIGDNGLRTAFEQMPVALRPADLAHLLEAVRTSVADPSIDLRQSAINHGVGSHAVDHLFGGAQLREDRIAALPDDQRLQVLAALGTPGAVGAAGPARAVAGTQCAPGRAEALAHATQLLQAGVAYDQVAQQAAIPEAELRRTFDREGRLLINRQGEFLLQLADGRLRAPFEALPRALRQGDLALLVDVFQLPVEDSSFSLRQAMVNAGVSQHALDFLFDGEDLREDRLASLPDDQNNALFLPGEPPSSLHMHSTRFARPARVAALLRAQQLIAGGMAPGAAAAQLELPLGRAQA